MAVAAPGTAVDEDVTSALIRWHDVVEDGDDGLPLPHHVLYRRDVLCVFRDAHK